MPATATPSWTCPKCRRRFARVNQAHTCSAATRAEVLKNRREQVVQLFAALEQHVKTFGSVEFIAREKYIILRGRHIFADVMLLADGLRIAIHLPKLARHPLFRKIIVEGKWVSHTAKVRSHDELNALQPFLRAAWDHSLTY